MVGAKILWYLGFNVSKYHWFFYHKFWGKCLWKLAKSQLKIDKFTDSLQLCCFSTDFYGFYANNIGILRFHDYKFTNVTAVLINKLNTYCIEGISETPNASADFYCQSNTNNHTETLCAFYPKSLQVNHRQNTQKERARYCEMGRERERKETEREYGVGLFEDSYFWFWPIVLNQHKYFWISELAISTQNLFWDACK